MNGGGGKEKALNPAGDSGRWNEIQAGELGESQPRH
jgi:hypothetical protein